jgi:hypothetical protein
MFWGVKVTPDVRKVAAIRTAKGVSGAHVRGEIVIGLLR